MAKVSIEIQDKEEGGVNCILTITPMIKPGEEPSAAQAIGQAFAKSLKEAFGDDVKETIL